MGVMTSFGGESSAGLGEGGGGGRGSNLLQCVLKLCCLRFKISYSFQFACEKGASRLAISGPDFSIFIVL